jgi:hypothetical protein
MGPKLERRGDVGRRTLFPAVDSQASPVSRVFDLGPVERLWTLLPNIEKP